MMTRGAATCARSPHATSDVNATAIIDACARELMDVEVDTVRHRHLCVARSRCRDSRYVSVDRMRCTSTRYVLAVLATATMLSSCKPSTEDAHRNGPPLRRLGSSLCDRTKSMDCIKKREDGTCFFVPSPPTCAVEHPDCWKHLEFPDVECP